MGIQAAEKFFVILIGIVAYSWRLSVTSETTAPS